MFQPEPSVLGLMKPLLLDSTRTANRAFPDVVADGHVQETLYAEAVLVLPVQYWMRLAWAVAVQATASSTTPASNQRRRERT